MGKSGDFQSGEVWVPGPVRNGVVSSRQRGRQLKQAQVRSGERWSRCQKKPGFRVNGGSAGGCSGFLRPCMGGAAFLSGSAGDCGHTHKG